MKGTTNSKLLTALKEIVQLNLITNQNSSSDLVGATITVECGGEVKNYTWDGNLINIEIPEGWEYTISVGDVSDYKTPSPVTFTSKGNSVTNVDMQYLTELVTITVTTEDGASANGSIINCNGTNHTYNGVFTKKFAYGTTYTITPNDFGEYNTDPVTYTAGLTNREISIIYSLGFPKGTTFEFEYTGSVLSVELKKGTYKLQCWGAQGGNVTGSYPSTGWEGGYSEGVLTLNTPTTVYVYVGGKGTNYTSSDSLTSTSTTNGGWNGGGSGARSGRQGGIGASSDNHYTSRQIKTFPRGGGGATDICTVYSDMTTSKGRTTRSSESYLSRFIVAGGGAGAISDAITETGPEYYNKAQQTISYSSTEQDDFLGEDIYIYNCTFSVTPGYYIYTTTDPYIYLDSITYVQNGETVTKTGAYAILVPSDVTTVTFNYHSESGSSSTVTLKEGSPTNVTSTYYISNRTQTSYTGQGGGKSGLGVRPGTISGSSGDIPGSFGYGANHDNTSYWYSPGGGAGWYGGGVYESTVPAYITNCVSYFGGGSGFVNIASNAKYRPTGYTGLELDSGTTIAGNKSFESPTGGTETGHSGNGYARITVL